MFDRIFKPSSKESYFIFGPRGTGKTSWLKSHYKSAPFFDLLEGDTLFDLSQSSKNLELRIGEKHRGVVIIDEIQKLPSLLDEVHRLIESRKSLQFILTGSSARKIKKQGVNLLAGRALVERFYPLTVEELGKDFKIEKALKIGLLPKAWTSENPGSFLKAYLQTYIDLEVRLEGLVNDFVGFNRFLQAASFSQASVLNVSAIASDCAVERRTVTNYFNLLNDLFISYELPVFAKRAKRELIKHKKFFFFDAGVFQTIRPRGPLDSDAEMRGAALETLVLQEIIAQNSYKALGYEIFFWRTKNNLEVDFILYGSRGLIAIEVKSSSRVRESDLQGLLEFSRDYDMAKIYLLYGGTKYYRHGKIEIIPVQLFLASARNYF